MIDPENFTPRLLHLLSNALVWRESAQLRARFNLGTNEFRVVSAVALRPGVAATEISSFCAEMHDAMMPVSTRGEEIILEGLAPEVVADFNRTLRDMLTKLRAYPDAHVGPLDLEDH